MTGNRLENRIIFFIMILISSLAVFFIAMVDRQQSVVMENLVKEDSARIRKIYQFTLKSLYHELENEGRRIIGNTEVANALEADTGSKAGRRMLTNLYQKLKADNPYLNTFRYHSVKKGTALRLDTQPGSGEKKTVLHGIVGRALETGKVQTGIEPGEAISYCIAIPVTTRKKISGVLEFGVNAAYMLDMLSGEFDIKSIMLIKDEQLASFIGGKDLSLIRKIGGYGVVQSNCGSFDLVDQLDEIEKNYYILQNRQNSDRLLFKGTDLHDCRGRLIGEIILVKNMDFFTKAVDLFKWVLGISSLTLLIVIFFILRYGFGFYIRDVKRTHRKLLHKNRILDRLKNLDHLTKIANRRRIDEVIRKEFKRGARYRYDLSLILFDVDNFKQVNDRYGHNRGDKVLKSITQLVTASLRESDYFGRWGGEEFVIVCTETSADDALKVAEKLRKVINEYEFEEVGTLSCSFGVSRFDFQESIEVCVHNTDKALYRAKAGGKNMVIRY